MLSIAGVLAPIVAGHLLGTEAKGATVGRWRYIFFVTAVLNAIAAVVWVALMRATPVRRVN